LRYVRLEPSLLATVPLSATTLSRQGSLSVVRGSAPDPKLDEAAGMKCHRFNGAIRQLSGCLDASSSEKLLEVRVGESV